MKNFEAAFAYLISDEGVKFVNDPDDSGGATKFGITQKSYSMFLKREASEVEMQEMTLEQAKEFYFKVFWYPMQLDQLPSQKVATALLDMGVNEGPGTAIKIAQAVTGAPEDAIVGPLTLKAITEMDPDEFIQAFHNKVLEHYSAIVQQYPKNQKYYSGWVNRSNRLLTLV